MRLRFSPFILSGNDSIEKAYPSLANDPWQTTEKSDFFERKRKLHSSYSYTLLCISVDFLFFETGPLLNSLSSLAANTGMNNSSLLLLFQSDHLSFRNRENPPLMIFVQIRIKHTFFTSIRNVIELKKL